MPRVPATRAHDDAPQIPPISPEIVIMTRAELLAIQRAEFNAGMQAARLVPEPAAARRKPSRKAKR